MDIQKERAAFEELQLGNGVTQLHRSEDGGYQSASLDYCWHIWIKSAETKLAEINQLKAKANVVPEGFVLVGKEKLHEWRCMANRSEELGCHDCFESRGYTHNLAEEIEALEVK